MPHIYYESKITEFELLRPPEQRLAIVLSHAAKQAGASETSSVRSDYSFRFFLAATDLYNTANLIKTFVLPNSWENPSPFGERRLVFFKRKTASLPWPDDITKGTRQSLLFVATFRFNARRKSDYENVRIMHARLFCRYLPSRIVSVAHLLSPLEMVPFRRVIMREPALVKREPGKSL